MIILGIETSCDETAAAVVEDGRRIYSSVVSSQVDDFTAYGGVIPEVAARSHIEAILPTIRRAMKQASCTWDMIDGIGVTCGPGLMGSLLVGVLAAQTLAYTKQKPLFPVHHVEGHVYANFLTEAVEGALPHGAILPDQPPRFPMLALIVSGGHSQLVLFQDHGVYTLLGQTQDDAVGEAFDKVAKIIGLPYPGGVSISQLAPEGDPVSFQFPKATLPCPPQCSHIPNRPVTQADIDAGVVFKGSRGEYFLKTRCHKYDFSFSGVKTAVLRTIQQEIGVRYDFPSSDVPERVSARLRANIAASFQRNVVETLVDKTVRAYNAFTPASVVIAGGVAANQELRRQLQVALPIAIAYAPPCLCVDNAAMIASLAYHRARAGFKGDPLAIEVEPSVSMTKTAWAMTQTH